MSVRKRSWVTSAGEPREAWIADYTDADGDRHIETFERKKDAEAFEATVRVDIGKGVHTAPSKSITVAEGCELWLEAGETRWERTTLDTYRQHANLHIIPMLGRVKLSSLTLATVRDFEDKLRHEKVSRAMTR